MNNGIKILAEMTLNDLKRTMGNNIQYSPRNGWHLTKKLHVLDDKSKKDRTTNNQPPPLLKDTNSPI